MNTRVILCVLLVSLFMAESAFAQTVLQDASGSISGLVELIKNSAAQWDSKLEGYAIRLFWILAVIQLVWTFFPLVMRQADFGEIIGELIRFIMVIGFCGSPDECDYLGRSNCYQFSASRGDCSRGRSSVTPWRYVRAGR